MGVTRLLLHWSFYNILTKKDQTFWRGVYLPSLEYISELGIHRYICTLLSTWFLGDLPPLWKTLSHHHVPEAWGEFLHRYYFKKPAKNQLSFESLLSPCWSALDFWKINFELNLIFTACVACKNQYRNWFLQAKKPGGLSTCALRYFFWLLSHVIYLKLTRELQECLLSQASIFEW